MNLDEQKKRLEERIQNPSKHWKFDDADLPERKLWPEYMKAYEDAISRTSTKWAPWYIIPANHKWYRDIVIGKIIVDTLKRLKMKYPDSKVDVSKIQIDG